MKTIKLIVTSALVCTVIGLTFSVILLHSENTNFRNNKLNTGSYAYFLNLKRIASGNYFSDTTTYRYSIYKYSPELQSPHNLLEKSRCLNRTMQNIQLIFNNDFIHFLHLDPNSTPDFFFCGSTLDENNYTEAYILFFKNEHRFYRVWKEKNNKTLERQLPSSQKTN